MTTAPVVSVEQGQLQGRLATSPSGSSFYSFQGIPYAKPPVGSLRFKDPQPAEKWNGIRDSTSEGNVTPQLTMDSNKIFNGDEDCLFLNVYSPRVNGPPLPVMIFIHGGGFKYGSGNTDLYGPDYLVEKDVILVTFNYRCGVLGFLSMNTPEVPGNAGMKDIVQAIRWVKNNIKNFGGDPDNLTVFGESAGAVAVDFLLVSPLTQNLINKAIVQSGPQLYTQKTPVENARSLAKMLGCNSDDTKQVLEFLRTAPVKDIVEAHEKINPTESFPEEINPFLIVIEKQFPGVEALITEPFDDLLTSGRVADIPVMMGVCALEIGSDKKLDHQLFIPEELGIPKNSPESLAIVKKLQQLYYKENGSEEENLIGFYQLLSDFVFKVTTQRIAKYLVKNNSNPVYYYNFDYVGAFNIFLDLCKIDMKRAMHMDELGYLFRNDMQKDAVHTPQDVEMREKMVRLWTNFAKTGNPTPKPDFYLPVIWQPVTKDSFNYLNLGTELSPASNPDKEKMDFWGELYQKVDRKTTRAAVITSGASREVIKANDPTEDDLPKNVGVNKFVNFYESLGNKK